MSVVIPTYRRPEALARCLEALVLQEYPRSRYEVIVVDDGSPEPASLVVEKFADRLELQLLVQPNAGPAAARNAGAGQAGGAILAFTDDDCEPRPGWLASLARCSAGAPDHAIGGRTVNGLAENPYCTASQMMIDYLYDHYNSSRDEARFFTSNNLAMPSAIFREIGGFATGFRKAAGEDRELCDRWLDRGYRLTYAPEAVVDHRHDLGLRTFLRQHFDYGRGAFQFREGVSRGVEKRLEPLSFYVDLVRYPATRLRGVEAARLIALLALTQVANAAGFFWQRWSPIR